MEAKIKRNTSLRGVRKLGFITPSSNTSLEPITAEMACQISDRISIHFNRVPVKALTLKSQDVDQFRTQKMLDAALLLQDAGLDAILWNGTSGSWTGQGLEADRVLCEAITESTGIPASTSSLALVEALKHHNIKRVGVAVPYVDAPTEKIIETYENAGFTVIKTAQLNETANIAIANTSFDRIKALLREADAPSVECLIVACTNLPAAIILDEMEWELGKPIFDSIAVSFWKAMQITEINVPLRGWGQLLRNTALIAELEKIMTNLLESTKASRTTLRLDIPEYNCYLDTVCCEAMTSGVMALKLDSSLNQKSLATVQWLSAHHKLLVQNDCSSAEIKPPKELIKGYGVQAQMLCPLIAQGQLRGWVSVHDVVSTREWSEREMAALGDAGEETQSLLQKHGWLLSQRSALP